MLGPNVMGRSAWGFRSSSIRRRIVDIFDNATVLMISLDPLVPMNGNKEPDICWVGLNTLRM